MQDSNEQSGFPFHETYLDYSGCERHFIVDISQSSFPGYIVDAREDGANNGYEFSAYSGATPYEALGEVRGKIRKGLATQYIRDGEHGLELTHDVALGRISLGGVVVNGQFVEFEKLNQMLQTYEGFNIELRISDPAK